MRRHVDLWLLRYVPILVINIFSFVLFCLGFYGHISRIDNFVDSFYLLHPVLFLNLGRNNLSTCSIYCRRDNNNNDIGWHLLVDILVLFQYSFYHNGLSWKFCRSYQRILFDLSLRYGIFVSSYVSGRRCCI